MALTWGEGPFRLPGDGGCCRVGCLAGWAESCCRLTLTSGEALKRRR